MMLLNDSSFPSTFFLTGIPGMAFAHIWISLPFFSMFFMAVTGNCISLFLIFTDCNLHQPMFFFLSMLSSVDLVLSLSTLPRMLTIFWFDATAISFHACLVQMFFIHAFSAMESGVLVAMGLDCYVAICNPRCYSSIPTPVVIAQIGGLVMLRGIGFTVSFPSLAQHLPCCGSHVIAYTYCEHMTVKLACGDTTRDNINAFIVALFLGIGDVAFIAYSYGRILQTVLNFPSHEAWAKAGSTCTAHVVVILFFYMPGFLSVIMQRVGPPTAFAVKVIFANLYLLFLPALNPIIYGVKTKKIRERLLVILNPKKIDPPPRVLTCFSGIRRGIVEVLSWHAQRGKESWHTGLAVPFGEDRRLNDVAIRNTQARFWDNSIEGQCS
ncbi:olfactory receptor 52K1-like [Phascolarctos cinereus]|uniref:Olfactory receptor 52K1-like n=1 Tax=Phascolarctos cinereus TaxID=38626 RepID=A0A6P5JDS2_PHACI|nr:olfactory receptor 52K1-like [Phascolarctos cinereus]